MLEPAHYPSLIQSSITSGSYPPRRNAIFRINDKYVEIFSNYDVDLVETESIFEKYKDSPPLLRNAPPIGETFIVIISILFFNNLI